MSSPSSSVVAPLLLLLLLRAIGPRGVLSCGGESAGGVCFGSCRDPDLRNTEDMGRKMLDFFAEPSVARLAVVAAAAVQN